MLIRLSAKQEEGDELISVVPDTNILVSGSIVPYGNPAFILDSWRAGKIQLVTSLEILDEFRRVMAENFDVPKDDIDFFSAFIIWKGIVVEPKQKIDIIKEDPSDNKILEAAIEGKADYIVSGDEHLKNIGSFEGIKIVSPAEFVKILKE